MTISNAWIVCCVSGFAFAGTAQADSLHQRMIVIDTHSDAPTSARSMFIGLRIVRVLGG